MSLTQDFKWQKRLVITMGRMTQINCQSFNWRKKLDAIVQGLKVSCYYPMQGNYL